MANRLAFYQKRDQQKERVYRWERSQREWFCEGDWTTVWVQDIKTRRSRIIKEYDTPRMSYDECVNFVNMVYRKLGRSAPPYIKTGRGARGGYHYLKLPVWARTKGVILHELAHNLSYRDGWCDAHGPWFMRYFIDLVARFLGQNKSALLKSAKAAGLKVAPASQAKINRGRSRSGKAKPTLRSSVAVAARSPSPG